VAAFQGFSPSVSPNSQVKGIPVLRRADRQFPLVAHPVLVFPPPPGHLFSPSLESTLFSLRTCAKGSLGETMCANLAVAARLLQCFFFLSHCCARRYFSLRYAIAMAFPRLLRPPLARPERGGNCYFLLSCPNCVFLCRGGSVLVLCLCVAGIRVISVRNGFGYRAYFPRPATFNCP